MTVIITLYSVDRTGASKMCYYIAEKLMRGNNKVILLHGKVEDKRNSYIPELENLGCKAHYVGGLSNPFYIVGVVKTLYFGWKYKADRLISMNLRDRIVGAISAKLLNIKSLVHCGNKHTYHGNPVSRFFKYFLYKNTVVKFTDQIICTSAVVRDELISVYNCNPEKLTLVYNGIYIKSADEISLRTSSNDQIQISFIGRLDVQKGLHVLLESIKIIRDERSTANSFFVTIVGDVTVSINQASSIEYKNRLLNYVKENNLEPFVKFLPFQNDVNVTLANTDIYVQPSLWEGLPLAVLEAMNYKLPLVITDGCNFPPSYKDGFHGLLVAKDNATLLAAALAKMINLPVDERKVYGINAYDLLVSDFNIENTTDSIIAALYK